MATKTLLIGGVVMEITPDRKRRIDRALFDTKELLIKQTAGIPEELQDQELVEFCHGHIEKLQGWLDQLKGQDDD